MAIILFDGGLDLTTKGLEGENRRVVNRLRDLGHPDDLGRRWRSSGACCSGCHRRRAMMLGAILIVSGPTVVTPILAAARPGKRLTTILGYEGTTIDPIGAIIAVRCLQRP